MGSGAHAPRRPYTLVISSSLDAGSKSRRLARAARAELESTGATTRLLDLRETPVPAFDNGDSFDSEAFSRAHTLIDGADSNEQSRPDDSLNGTQLLRAAFYDRPLVINGVTLTGDGLSPVLSRVEGTTPADVVRARVEATLEWIDNLKAMLAGEWGATDTSGRSDDAAVRALQLKLDADSMRRLSLFAELAPIALPALERLKVLVRAAGVDDQGARNDVWV